MLLLDEQFAQEVIDAFDVRCLPKVPRVLNREGKEERYRLERQYWMLEAALHWLERWEDNPANGSLEAGGDPLGQAVARLHDSLESSRQSIRQQIEEMNEAANLLWSGFWPA
jgi:hypothetical protein